MNEKDFLNDETLNNEIPKEEVQKEEVQKSENSQNAENNLTSENAASFDATNVLPNENQDTPIQETEYFETPKTYQNQQTYHKESEYHFKPNEQYQQPQQPQQNQQYNPYQNPQYNQYQNQSYNQYQNNNQQDYYQNPQQQQTWAYNDYANAGSCTTNGYPPQQDKQKKKGKKPKTEKSSKGKGLRAFAIVVSILLVVSIGSFGGYVIWDNLNNNKTQTNNGNGKTPTLNINDAPEIEQKTSANGLLSPVEVNKKVGPSVVGIVTYVKGMGYEPAGEGSGVIMSKDGFIVTNAHVVTDSKYKIAKIEVVLSNKETYTAKIVGADKRSDLAVLKITANNLTPAVFGNSDKLQVGETAYVIGNPSGLQFAGSFTAGCISALDRKLQANKTTEAMTFIQTDAAINPGNSGGALVNQFGQVVGISSAKIADESVEGMGFAIPISIAKPVVDSIMENGYVKGRIKIGITYTSITQTLADLYGVPVGLRVVDISPDCDVSEKDIKKGDIITKINGKGVYDQATINKALENKKPGDEVSMTVCRVDESEKAKTFDVKIILNEDTSEGTKKIPENEE